jgi:hypothetical protein
VGVDRRWLRVGGVGVALTLALLAASCSGSDGSASDDTTPDRSTTTRNTTPSAEDAARADAIAAYDAMWQDMAAASLTADYQSPRLAEHAAGNALSVLNRGVYVNQQRGIVVKGEPMTNPTVTGLEPADAPTTATISDCFDATNWLNYVAATGELEDDVPGGRHQTTATVTDMDGSWKVTELQVGAVDTC